MRPKLLPSTALAIVMLSIIAPASGQLILNVYMDGASSQRALILGSVDDLSGLEFLDSCQMVQEDGGQIYAICDSLIVENSSVRTLRFPASGYYDEYHVSFFIPGGEELLQINATSGLQFFSTEYNGTLLLDVQGCDLTDPSVTFSFSAA